MNLDKRLLTFLRHKAVLFGFCVFLGCAAGIFAVVQARQLSVLVNGIFLAGWNISRALPAFGVLLLLISARVVSAWGSERVGSNLARLVKSELRKRLAEKIFRLGPLFAARKPTGEVIAAAQQGIEALDPYFSQFLPQVFFAVIIPVVVLALVFPVDWVTGIILLVTGPLIPVFMFLIGSNAEKLTRQQFGLLSRLSAALLDALQGLRALKELGRSREQADRIETISARYRDVTLGVLRVTFLSALVLELLGTLSTAVVAVQIGLRLLYGQMNFLDAFFILVVAPDFYLPLRTLGLRFHASMNGVSAARKIYAILDEPEPLPVEVGAAVPVPYVPDGDWTFEAVSYRYSERESPALQEVSFRVSRGTVTALVGESGAGKSTLLSLAMRFMDAQSGSIRVGGKDLRDIPPAAWREQVMWIPQQAHWIHGTIADNLRLGKCDASTDDLERVLDQTLLVDWVRSLPQHWDTSLGEAAARASGGQVQRLAIARALLRPAQWVIMDEPTAHLDSSSEAKIHLVLQKVLQGKTVLMAAHRLATVVSADQILVLEGGRIVEAGRHADLVRLGASYSRLVRAGGV
ncbi:MAG: thiol reductant ABC exporter subunit CydD [Anaerolineae bacterium]|nr:thiol reductant ABC exporter subunit CydD [Anaerolineae bacterium]